MTMHPWDEISKHYDADNLLAQRHILWPNIKEEMEKILSDFSMKPISIIDVGCGSGEYLYYFQKVLKMHAIGIDPSKEQLCIAKEKFPNLVTYHFSIETFQSPIPFNIAFANMVICNIETQEKLQQFFKAAHRLTTENGKLLITNVAALFQRSCQSKSIWQQYPKIVTEGVPFKIRLEKINGSHTPIFTNYHWSTAHLQLEAVKHGWQLHSITPFFANVENPEEWPTYSLLEFQK